uniref:NAD(P)H-quinone oxidoreductase subunit 5, chloroplastic n=1 Tax=Coniogramme intermedia TaxID=658545 RepID=A0A7T8E478_9MONI|nr:NADH-plastoquinone oxidoreductase subunit 5 [Coniogramme intermedia]QQO79399.1 NADH-plastoquinone oxidoreductase subunit 5 [Coniogramme intermedia]
MEKIGFVNPIFANVIALLLFLGPVAKSAQFPLHVWLPDATEGPTPISALIHAATMVAAGIFFLARIFNLISILPPAMHVISWVGGVTALLGATLALAQKDIKKSLAYSTMSQLGYMVLAMGIGAYRSALFHLVTHAYSKALSFLGAGSVIHSVEEVVGYSPSESQNMFLMGGLRKYMPITGTTFLPGTLSLCGIPPLACFWSKDEIIAGSWLCSPPLGLIASGTAGLTAFYMSRIHFLTFEGNFRASETNWIDFRNSPLFPSTISLWGMTELESSINEISRNPGYGVAKTRNLSTSDLGGTIQARSLLQPRESNFAMTTPLVALAIPTTSIGLAGVDVTEKSVASNLLSESFSLPFHFWETNKSFEILMEILANSTSSLSLSLSGIILSFIIYGRTDIPNNAKNFAGPELAETNLLSTFRDFIQSWSLNRGYIDYCHDICFVRGLTSIGKLVSSFDQRIIDGFVNAIGASNFLGGEVIRYGGSGRISLYLFVLVVATSLLMLVAGIPPFP